MASQPADEGPFERLGDLSLAAEGSGSASSRLKSRIFSALNLAQAQSGPLLSLRQCKADGGQLCIFEELVRIVPAGAAVQEANYCRVCHARVLGESVENAPIWWAGCPYAQFQER